MLDFLAHTRVAVVAEHIEGADNGLARRVHMSQAIDATSADGRGGALLGGLQEKLHDIGMRSPIVSPERVGRPFALGGVRRFAQHLKDLGQFGGRRDAKRS